MAKIDTEVQKELEGLMKAAEQEGQWHLLEELAQGALVIDETWFDAATWLQMARVQIANILARKAEIAMSEASGAVQRAVEANDLVRRLVRQSLGDSR